jgi:hypothetical protein
MAFKLEEDMMMLDQLPVEVQEEIFKDFLYSDFLFSFKKHFVFTRFDIEG